MIEMTQLARARDTRSWLAISVRHRRALKDLIPATIDRAEADGFLEASRSVSGGAA
jgi:hypothetical protein